MKVRCITDKIEKLDKDKIYTPIDEDEEFYLIESKNKTNYWYGKNAFEIVKENDMKFKVGDKVKVKEYLSVGSYYGGQFYVRDMSTLKGAVVTIKSVNESWYEIEELNYMWTDEMLELIEEGKENTMKISKWEELNNLKSYNYCIKLYGAAICILNNSSLNDCITIGSALPIKRKIEILKSFGFDIEFVEEPTLTRKEFEFLKCFEYSENKSISRLATNLIFFNGEWNTHLDKDMFKFIKNGESWKVEDLLKLKVEDK